MKLEIISDKKPMGDQPKAIEKLTEGLRAGKKDQVLLGVTGSGKTFTMANVIQAMQRPTLIMAHNKTLAAQLYGEMKELFPKNAVEYFVSYYDYYQPEAYIAKTDTFIEKDSAINEQIDLLRHSATRSLMERKDVIIVSSVSCIYGIGSAEHYSSSSITISKNSKLSRNALVTDLIRLQYLRNDISFIRGTFRVKGDTVDIIPSYYENVAIRFEFFGDDIDDIYEFDPLTMEKLGKVDEVTIYPNTHYVTSENLIRRSINAINDEMERQCVFFKNLGKLVEDQRIRQRTNHDIEVMLATGSCKGIENYSRYLTGRSPGDPPPTLFEYFPKDALLFVDESHVTVPQVGAMFNGDRSRKNTLVEHGFRLPSALDNRPLKFEEWDDFRPQTVFVSATPGPREMEKVGGEVVQQIIRPTGLLDPICIVKPANNQVDDVLEEIRQTISKGFKTLVITLTKKMAEDLSEYFSDIGIKVRYLHSNIDTLERIEIINLLRKGEIDVIIGINLLREGLDIPECALVAIMDADKEGFLRSEQALIQTIGRAARNSEGKVILYANVITKSIQGALDTTSARRKIQEEHNKEHGITPTTVYKKISDAFEEILGSRGEDLDIDLEGKGKKKKSESADKKKTGPGSEADNKLITLVKEPKLIQKILKFAHLDNDERINLTNELTKVMFEYSDNLQFERAAEMKKLIEKMRQLMM